MDKTSTSVPSTIKVTRTINEKFQAPGEGLPAMPRRSTLARIRQFARAYSPCPSLQDAPGFVLN